jgi:hypothetical protein
VTTKIEKVPARGRKEIYKSACGGGRLAGIHDDPEEIEMIKYSLAKICLHSLANIGRSFKSHNGKIYRSLAIIQ